MPRKMDPLYDSFGTLQPRVPSPLERIASQLSQLAYGNDDRAGTQNMLGLLGNSPNRTPERRLVDMLNPLATIDAAWNSGQDIGKGNTLAGLLGLGLAAAPIPGKQGIRPGVRRVTLFHGTSPEAAASIRADGKINSGYYYGGLNGVALTPRRDMAKNYGDEVLQLDVPFENLRVDPESVGHQDVDRAIKEGQSLIHLGDILMRR